MLHIIAAKYLADYKISVAFDDGCRCVADFENVIESDLRSVVRLLLNLDLFRAFKLRAHTIVWSNGTDFAPAFIKELSLH